MADIFFSLIAIFFILIVIGLCWNIVDRLCGRYGGILGTIVTFLINAVEFGFIFWLVGKIIPIVDWKLGMEIGVVYCGYCWLFRKENKMVGFIFDLFER